MNLEEQALLVMDEPEAMAAFCQWAFGNSDQFCDDAEALMIAIIGGSIAADSAQVIGDRSFDLLKKWIQAGHYDEFVKENQE